MSASEKPIIAVCGATGRQGGSVVEALLKQGKFRVRALTRKVNSESANKLKEKSVEVVQADYKDLESLKKAFEGAYGVFAVTNFWEDPKPEVEEGDGKRLVDAAKAVDTKHFIWSNVCKPPNDIQVAHWISKDNVNKYVIESGIPRTTLNTSFFFENMWLFDSFRLKKTDDPKKFVADWPFCWTDGKLGGYAVSDTGLYAAEIFANPEKWLGKDVFVVSSIFTAKQFVEKLNDVLKEKGDTRYVEYVTIPEEKFNLFRQYSEELWTNQKSFFVANGRMRDMNLKTEEEKAASKAAEEIEKETFKDALTMEKFIELNAEKILESALDTEPTA